jgi:hemolysin III
MLLLSIIPTRLLPQLPPTPATVVTQDGWMDGWMNEFTTFIPTGTGAGAGTILMDSEHRSAQADHSEEANRSPKAGRSAKTGVRSNTLRGISRYSKAEERVNVVSHGIGFSASIIALILLLVRALSFGDAPRIISFSIFGISLVTLYAASTLYHAAKEETLRSRLKVFDHTAIYVLIAGTYTPFTLVTLHGTVGWVIFGISWGAAITGIILKFFFIGRFRVVSTVMYVLMGWLIVFAAKPLAAAMPAAGLSWLAGGGLAYTLGAVLYIIRRIPFNHAMFHILVLAGSACHWVAVYGYV